MNKKVDFDEYTQNYNELLRENTSFFSSSEEYFARYKVEIVERKIKNTVSNVLEYGCGIGRNIPYLQKAFPDAVVCGSDISAASLDIAKNDMPDVEFFLETDQLKCEKKFDLIFVAGVFHHVAINQRLQVAKELFNRLTPEGLLFVFEQNPYNPVTRHIVNNCPYDEDAVLLKPSELKGTLTQAGLHVKEHGYCLFVPPKLSKLVWIESKLQWLPLGGQYWVEANRPKA